VPELLCRLGEDYFELRRIADARRVLAEAGDLMERKGEVYWEPELVRLRGRLAAAERQGEPAEAAAAFERALALARQRGAHLLELRAATDLARLRSAQGQRAAARQVLAPIYASFTEGFHATDLKEAKAMLNELETDE
jgi:predicted ATPase